MFRKKRERPVRGRRRNIRWWVAAEATGSRVEEERVLFGEIGEEEEEEELDGFASGMLQTVVVP